MDTNLGSALLVLAGAVVGALAAILGPLVAARTASRSELRRAGMELGLREWDFMRGLAEKRNASLFPPALFVFYSTEVLKLIENGTLTAESYAEVIKRHDAFKAAITTDTLRRQAERVGGDQR